MLFEVTFVNKENHFKKFITSGESEAKCMELAKRYIKQNGGSTSPARMSKLRKLPS